MTARSKLHQALNDYAHFWSLGDWTRALAALEAVPQHNPAGPEFWWYRLCAQEKLGLTDQVRAELEAAEKARAGPRGRAPRYPGEKGAQVLAAFQGSEYAPPTLFALTLDSASVDLVRLFLDRLGPRRLPALGRRLAALDPDSVPALTERARQYLGGIKTWLDEALPDLKALLLSKPAEPGHLVKIICLWQAYEDTFEAWNQVAGLGLDSASSDRTGPYPEWGHAPPKGGLAEAGRPGTDLDSHPPCLADFIEEAFQDVLLKSRRGSKSDLDSFGVALKTVVESLRAGYSLERAAREFFSFDTRKPGEMAVLSFYSAEGQDFVLNLKMLAVARNIYYLAHQRPTPVVPVDLAEQTRANRRFLKQAARGLLPQGYRFLGLFEQESLSAAANSRALLGGFLSPCGRTLVAAITVKPKWASWVEWLFGMVTGYLWTQKVLGASSLMTDGWVLSTMKATIPNYFDQSPLLITVRVSRWTSAARLIQKHEKMLRQYQADNHGVGCRSFNGPAALEELLFYQAKVESEFRQTLPDFINPAEMRRMVKFNFKKLSALIIASLRKLDRMHRLETEDHPDPSDLPAAEPEDLGRETEERPAAGKAKIRRLGNFVKNVLIWSVIMVVILLAMQFCSGSKRGAYDSLSPPVREQIRLAQAQREEAEPLIDHFLKQLQPAEDDRARLLANEAVKQWGCWILHHRMRLPFVSWNLQPSDVDLPEYRRMFALLEALAATEGVVTMPYGPEAPGRVISGGLEDLMKIYDLFDDLESAQAAYERLKAMPAEDDYLGMARGDGAYRMVKLYGRAGRPAEAEKARDEMMELMKPESQYYFVARTHLHLAAAWAGTGDLDKAAAYYDRLKDLGEARDIAMYRLEAIESLEPAYRRAGNHQKADQLRAEAEALMKIPGVARFVKMQRERRPFI